MTQYYGLGFSLSELENGNTRVAFAIGTWTIVHELESLDLLDTLFERLSRGFDSDQGILAVVMSSEKDDMLRDAMRKWFSAKGRILKICQYEEIAHETEELDIDRLLVKALGTGKVNKLTPDERYAIYLAKIAEPLATFETLTMLRY